MRLHIQREEKEVGLFKKKRLYSFRTKLEFTAEETAIIEAHGYRDYVFIRPKDNVAFFVKHFMSGERIFNFHDFMDAQEFEVEFKEKANGLKTLINASGSQSASRTETYEL